MTDAERNPSGQNGRLAAIAIVRAMNTGDEDRVAGVLNTQLAHLVDLYGEDRAVTQLVLSLAGLTLRHAAHVADGLGISIDNHLDNQALSELDDDF